MNEEALLAYRVRQLLHTTKPGFHRGAMSGSTGLFRDHVPFSRHPETRRIDLRATLRDPFGDIHVRRFTPKCAVDVYALVDLSASMAYQGWASRQELVRDLCIALARAAYRYGDAFGMLGADTKIHEDFTIKPSRRPGLETLIIDKFDRVPSAGANASGLREALPYLAGHAKLVFLLSDFRFPLAFTDRLLEDLGRHDIVPIVIEDTAEHNNLPSWGLMKLRDLETGAERLLFLRPSLRKKLIDAATERKDALHRLFLRHRQAPVYVTDRLDIDAVSQQLMET
ncbi:DUF58 domain-containing protein [Beijerinckia mobilis]|uniref:DUF58 domain-containing protein n=1 Tax=Beijerinckia mobilis TaxID=231434 RepID=UPI000556B6AC|nr:Mxas protein [Beijerinckia mobilis]